MKKQSFFLLSALLFLHLISLSQKTDSIVNVHSTQIHNLTQQVSGIKKDVDTIKTKITPKTRQMDYNHYFKLVLIILSIILFVILCTYTETEVIIKN
jgi:hypothetical protein